MTCRIKILTVLGARPQFVKAAVVSRAISSHNSSLRRRIKEVIVHTGQHYDANMSDIFFEEMAIPKPDYKLGICDCSHGAMTGRMLEQTETILLKERPDIVLVYGDTNSTLAGALAAIKIHIPVAHVEAGLRSFNIRMPEEINRILTDRISTFLFCPTETAVRNLSREGIRNNSQTVPKSIVSNVGDVMYDAVLFYRNVATPSASLKRLIKRLGANFYLATVHRAETADEPQLLRNVVRAFNMISRSTPIIFPAHPRTLKKINACRMDLNRINLIDPVGYFDMLTLLANCKAIFTDSGGLQKEAYFFKKPCILLRDETEWVELVKHKFSVLVGADMGKIVDAERHLDRRSTDYSISLYGNGRAGEKIVRILAGV